MAHQTDDDDVVKAISTLMSALKPLDPESRAHVVEFVTRRLSIAAALAPNDPGKQGSAVHGGEERVQQADTAAPSAVLNDIRSFAASKKPKTVNEKVAVIAFYLAHLAPQAERRDHIISDDIKTYFIQADFELPTAPAAMTLSHAKNAGYLNALDRGQYKLNAVGHNLVAHKLPATESGGSRRRAPARKAAKAKAKKAR